MKRGMLAACVVFFFTGVSTVHADTEFNIGLGVGWENLTELGFGFYMPLNLGYTSADIETETIWLGGERMYEKVKTLKQFDFDILGDLTIGLPFSSAGALFNLYLSTSDSFSIGVGVGAGYSVGFNMFGDEYIFHGPYIKGNIPIILVESIMLSVTVDYFFFKKHCTQISGTWRVLL